MAVVWFFIACVWAVMFFLEQHDKRKERDAARIALKSAYEAINLMKEIRSERDHLRRMLVGMAGIRWVASDGSRSVEFQLSRPNTFYVENGETKH